MIRRTLPSLPNPADVRAITAYRLRHIEGKQIRDIAEELNCHPKHVQKLVVRGAKLCVAEELRDSARSGTLAELDALRSKAYEYLHGEYMAAQFGKIVTEAVTETDPVTGHERTVDRPVRDIGPNLAALDRILKIEKRRAEIYGYDAPKRTTVNVVTEDAIIAEINRLEAQMAQAEAELAAQEGAWGPGEAELRDSQS